MLRNLNLLQDMLREHLPALLPFIFILHFYHQLAQPSPSNALFNALFLLWRQLYRWSLSRNRYPRPCTSVRVAILGLETRVFPRSSSVSLMFATLSRFCYKRSHAVGLRSRNLTRYKIDCVACPLCSFAQAVSAVIFLIFSRIHD